MTNEIKAVLDHYINQLKSLQYQLGILSKKPEPNKILGNEIGAKLIGALAKDIFKSKEVGKIGEKVIRAKLDSDEKILFNNRIQSYEQNFNIIMGQIRPFLGSLSIVKSNLNKDGNSHILLKKLASLESTTKAESKIRKAITILSQIREEPLISTNNISKFLEERRNENKIEYYEILKELENNLRDLIESRLSKLSKNWWKERIPEDVRQKAEELKLKKQSPWPWHIDNNRLIEFVDFTDYSKIIMKKDNWNDIFKKIFHDEKWITTKLKELEPIRNDIAHSRDLSSKQKQRLELNHMDITECINQFKE